MALSFRSSAYAKPVHKNEAEENDSDVNGKGATAATNIPGQYSLLGEEKYENVAVKKL